MKEIRVDIRLDQTKQTERQFGMDGLDGTAWDKMQQDAFKNERM